MELLYFPFVFVTLIALCRGQRNPEACVENPEDNDCLAYIRDVAMNRDMFWFGNDYEERCRDSDNPVECLNPIGQYDNSIVSLTFGDDGALDDLDRFLYVQYTSEPFRYRGCGTEVDVPETSFDLDMSLEEQQPATLRDLPQTTWDYEEGDIFTVMMVDPGFSVLHGLHINLEGNDGETGDIIRYYQGPLNFRFTPNPYAFVLFKQAGRIEWVEEWTDVIDSGAFVQSLSDFKSGYGLTGPVAMNILLVGTDIYAVNAIQSIAADTVQYCSAYVQNALVRQDEDFLPDDIMLRVFLNVAIRSEDLDVSYCCEDNFFPARTTVLDPLGRELVRAADVRSGSRLQFSVNITGLPPMIDNYRDTNMLVMMVDPDATRPMLHYLAFDMRLDATSSFTAMLNGGREAVSFLGPAPPDNEQHTYYFLLFAQPANRDLDPDLGPYVSEQFCPESVEGRCDFEVASFVRESGLTLVGASWMRVGNDDYVDYLWGLDESEYCDRYPPCNTPLPPSAASGLQLSVLAFLLCSVFAAMF